MKDYNYTESDIQKYILEELSKEEVIKFEKAMKENPDFALEVDNHRQIAKSIEYYGGQKFKTRIKDIYEEVRPEIISKKKPKQRYFSIFKIASAALLATILMFLLNQYMTPTTKITPQEIYAQNFKTYNWNPSLRSDEATVNLDRALNLYTSKSYDEAIPLIESLIEENPNNIPARLAIANAHLENDSAEFAIPHLEHILTLDDVLYQDQANWYLGLAYLRMGQQAEAKSIFQNLASNPSADYFNESDSIIQQMD